MEAETNPTETISTEKEPSQEDTEVKTPPVEINGNKESTATEVKSVDSAMEEEAPPKESTIESSEKVPENENSVENADEKESQKEDLIPPLPEDDKSEKVDAPGDFSLSELNLPPVQTLGKGKRARIPNKRYSDILLSPQRTSKVTFENGEKYEKVESESELSHLEEVKEDIASMKSRSSTSSPVIKRTKSGIDLSNLNFRKPFLYGWKREMVYRANSSTNKSVKRDGEVYYVTPQGKKLRSMREISENLMDKELNVEDFTFYKEPLGIDDPEKEIIREAKMFSKVAKGKGGKVASPKGGSKTATPKNVSPMGSPAGSNTPTPNTRTRVSLRGLGNIKVKLPPKRGDKRKPDDDKDESPAPKRTAVKKGSSKAVAANLGMESKPCQPCSIRCEGVSGVVPTLQCRLCLCLYHYECIGLSPHVQIQAYVCKNCQLEHGHTVASTASIVLPPLTSINALKAVASQSNALPKLQRIPRAPDSPPEAGGPSVAPSPPKAAEGRGLVGAVTSWLPHSSTIQVDDPQRNKENEPLDSPRPQYVEFLAGRKFLVIPKRNVVSISPTSRVNNRGLVDLGLVEASGGEGTTQDTGGVEGRSGETRDLPERIESPVPNKRTIKSNSISSTSEKNEESKSMENYLQNLSYGYNTLLYVFQYLKVQDLLRAGCVCTMWRDISRHASLWHTVRMKNSQVHSFEGLANSLAKHGTVNLDLRKMLLPNGGDDIWPEFSKAIAKVQTLRKIELCRSPASVVEQLAVTNTELKVINAVTIKCESINLDMLSNLTNLEELRLKSTSGLTLSSDITSLKALSELKHLCLTSVKDLHSKDLTTIGELNNLQALDLGECTDFPSSFGETILRKLPNLERLRLEKGQGDCHVFEILDAVKEMPKLDQLELVNFDIKAGFDLAMGACSNIKKLLIIPTYISQSATTNHMVLGGVLRLRSTLSHFVWGVTLELLRVTELFVDQCEDSEKKEKKEKKTGTGDSIPVLKPVPIVSEAEEGIPPAHDPPQVEILPLPNLQKLLLQSLPTTRVKILKIPFHATWRQSITDTVN